MERTSPCCGDVLLPLRQQLLRRLRRTGGRRGPDGPVPPGAELGLYLVGGTVPELSEGRIYNTSYVYGPDGRQLAKHRKAHLFDIDVQGDSGSGSRTPSPREMPSPPSRRPSAPWGCASLRPAVRGAGPVHVPAGAKVIFVPAAFNMTTGPAHWELLFRQRAVDNQCFTVGVSPARDEQGSYVAYGNSIAVDPWGAVLCRAGAEETTCTRTWTWNGWRRYGPSCPSSPPGGRICMRCGRSERHSLRRIL